MKVVASGACVVAKYDCMDNEAEPKIETSRPTRAIPYGMCAGRRLYVCRRCQANFMKGGGLPDLRHLGLGKCNVCIASSEAKAAAQGRDPRVEP